MPTHIKEWHVKFDGPCARCGELQRAGSVAHWDSRGKKLYCLNCAIQTGLRDVPAEVEPGPHPARLGTAGGSTRREYERRSERREADLQERWGQRVGGWVLRFAAEPQSIRAWGIGAAGEEQLGAALAEVPDLWTLNDRRVKGSKANIDHILVAPAGVFVVDAKAYSGLVQVRDVGGFFRRELRLYVGGRDRSKLADGLAWQVSAVRAALGHVDLPIVPRITPVLCFIGSQWPRFRPPNEFEGVRLEDPGSLRGLLGKPIELGPAETEQFARRLATELPAR